MKIVYTILGTFNSGGMERVLANKANYLASLGHEIIIITTDQQDRPSFFALHESIRCIDLAINYTSDLNEGLIKRTLRYYKKQKLHKQKLEEVLNDIKPHITISMFDNDASFVPSIHDGSKKIAEIHFSRFKRIQYGNKGLKGLIDKIRNNQDLAAAKRYDKFIVLTHEDKVYWGELNNIAVIPNANSFESSEQAKLINKQVIAIGRYDYQKGFDELIHIWKVISSHSPDWKLKIYGHGPLKPAFERLIDSLDLQDSVFLMPPTKDIQQAYLDSSILVMTSRYEGLPMVLLEGQVCGLPMVSYACKCGPKDIITDGENGFLIEEGDRKQFAEKLMLLINDANLRERMGMAAKENSSKYAEDKIMHMWIKLFNEVIDG